MYDRTSWRCVSTFTDDHHKEVSVQGEEGRRRRVREEIVKFFCSSAVGPSRVRMMFLIFPQNINVVAWSPCGQYIGAGGVDGRVTVWDAASRKSHQRSEVMRNNVLTAHRSKKREESRYIPRTPPFVPWYIPRTPPPLSPGISLALPPPPPPPPPSLVPWYVPRTPPPLST